MNELATKSSKVKTARELAAELNVTDRTIRNAAVALDLPRKTFSMVVNGTKMDVRAFDEVQATAIVNYLQRHHENDDKAVMSADNSLLLLKDISAVLRRAEVQIHLLEDENKELKIRLDECDEYSTVRKFCALNNINAQQFAEKFGCSVSQAGKQITRYCDAHGFDVRRAEDERYGSTNSYPVEVLRAAFGDEYRYVPDLEFHG